MTTSSFDLAFIKYDPKLGDILGRGASMFISTLQFLLNNQSVGIEKEGKKWVYNTSEQWAQYIGYSSRQVERIVSRLSHQGIIVVQKLSRCKSNRTNYYTVDEDKLNALLQEKVLSEVNTNPSLKQLDASLHINNINLVDKMSECSRHEGGLSTKNTSEETKNKSDRKASALVGINQVSISGLKNQKDQVEQVKNIKTEINNTKTPIVQEMVSIWNKVLEKSPTTISKQLAPLLVAAYKNKFNSDIKQWELYCQMIASSSYLMGESFNLSLLWALKYTTIERIKNLEFGVKEINITQTYTQEDAIRHINSLKESLRCKEVRSKLLKVYGPLVYLNWIKDLQFLQIQDNICFKAKNKFIEDYIMLHYGQVFNNSMALKKVSL